MRRVIAATAAGLVGAATLLVPTVQSVAAPKPPPAPTYTAPAPDWGTCDSARLQQAGAECADLQVPLDWDDPKGEKISIAVSRVLHTDDDYKGMIAVNPGGPGGSGLIYSVLGGAIPDGVGAKYDWYGFDPRGVGASTPALSCNPDYPGLGFDRPDYVPDVRADYDWWRGVTRQYAKDCGNSDAAKLLPHMRTVDVARDLDALRQAVGQKTLNYYGFSYGTYLGQVYATLFPQRVGRFVWDGVLDAGRAFHLANLDQDIAFDKNIDIYFRWLADNNAAYGLGTDWQEIKAGYYEQLDKLDANPAAGGKLGPSELSDVMLSAGYYVFGWAEIGAAYAKLVKTGDGTDLLANYAGPGDDNSFSVYLAVQCTDAPWPKESAYFADIRRTARKAPFLTWGNAWFNAPCLDWPVPSDKRPFRVDGSKVAAKILMVAETNDAATPYSGALAPRKAFRTSSLIEGVGGTTHSGSLSGIACTDNAIARYLDTGETPARVPGKNRSDLQCDPVPPPAAEGSTLAAAKGSSRGDRLPAALRDGLEQAQAPALN